MAADNGWTHTQKSDGNTILTISHPVPEGNDPTIESGSWSNVTDGDTSTYIELSLRGTTVWPTPYVAIREYFYITPDYSSGSKMSYVQIKVWCDERIKITQYNTDGTSSVLYDDSGKTVYISRTYSNTIDHIEIMFEHSSAYVTNYMNIKVYEISCSFLAPSHFCGYDGSNVIRFAKSGDYPNKLKGCYAKSGSTAYYDNLALVADTSPLASKFAVYTADGAFRIAKYF